MSRHIRKQRRVTKEVTDGQGCHESAQVHATPLTDTQLAVTAAPSRSRTRKLTNMEMLACIGHLVEVVTL